MGEGQNDELLRIEAVVNREGEFGQHATTRQLRPRPANRVVGDVLDGRADFTKEIVATTRPLFVVAIGAAVELAFGRLEESDSELARHVAGQPIARRAAWRFGP